MEETINDNDNNNIDEDERFNGEININSNQLKDNNTTEIQHYPTLSYSININLIETNEGRPTYDDTND